MDADVAPPSVVFKFGGTSVGAVDRFQTVVDLIGTAAETGRVVAVVSALGHVTRRLSRGMEAFATDPSQRPAVVQSLVDDLRARHLEQAEAVLGPDRAESYEALLEERLRHLRECFARVERQGFTPALRDAVLATGEQLAVPLVTLALRDAGLEAPHCDATALMVTDATHGEANVDFDTTAERVRTWYGDLPSGAVPVVAGFIGATREGTTTTLGFEGSDYSAALFARILEAQCLTRYTDVDGLYSEDPEAHADAERLERLSMDEAYAMTESGRLGMHPKTLRPLVDADIPMQVRSIVEPGRAGTQIVPEPAANVPFTPPVGVSPSA